MIVCPWKDIARYLGSVPGLQEAMDVVNSKTFWEVGTTQLSGGNRIMVMEGTTRSADGALFEAHRKFLDIQYILEGQEYVGWAPLEQTVLEGEFSEEKDIGMYSGKADFLRIAAGNCYVVFPEDAHAPTCHLDAPNAYKKMVIKLKV